jgi:protein ImuA
MMHHALLDRSSYRPADAQPLLGRLGLARARVHEAHGAARALFALLLAREMAGPIFWIAPAWAPAQLYPPGVAAMGVDPGRITFVHPDHAQTLLWTLEEVLRSGAVPLAVAELPGPPALTPMRRLQLAAEAGAEAGSGARRAPIGLILTPEGAAPGAESRWQMAPAHGGNEAEHQAWTLTRERARTEAPARWRVLQQGSGFGLAPAG